MTTFSGVDEYRHQVGSDPDWIESWRFNAITDDGSVGIAVGMHLEPGRNRAHFNFSVVRAAAPLVHLADPELGLPTGRRLEVRAPGLWFDIGVQTPMSHVTVDVEAFGVELDDPEDVFAGARGHRLPVGSELEWELDGDVAAGPVAIGYELPCVVHGELLLGHEAIDIVGRGWRSHRWGSVPSGRPTELRGHRRDGAPVRVNDADQPTWELLGSAPVLDRSGRLDQRLVRSAPDELGWLSAWS